MEACLVGFKFDPALAIGVLDSPPPDEILFFTPLTSASDLSSREESSFEGSTFVGPPLEYTPV